MKTKIALLLTFITTSLFAQDYTKQWDEYYSYLQISGIATHQDNIIASVENAFFNYNTTTQKTTNTSTLNGMSGKKISYFYYSAIYNLSIIGYENGLLEIVSEEKETTTIVDIINKPNIPGNQKRINHIYEHNGVVYLSCDYGISVYNLDNLEFGDTYYMGAGGAQIQVNQTAIIGDYIYAATSTEGMKKALHADSNIIDFSLWQSIPSGFGNNWKTVVNFNNTLYTINNNKHIYSFDGTSFTDLFTYTSQIIKDHRVHENKMLVTTKDNVYLYDNLFNNSTTINYLPEYNSKFTVSTVLNNEIYVGTENDGLLHFSIDGNFIKNIKPNGPTENNIFSVTANNNEVWAVYGAHSIDYNPYPLDSKGYSYFSNQNWSNIPFLDVLNARSLVAININPFNENQVFISSYFSGLLEISNGIPTTIWNNTNSPIETLGLYFPTPNPNYIDLRVGASVFDKNGKLWITQARVDNALKAYDPQNDTWETFSFSNIIAQPLLDEYGFSSIEIDDNNNKWIGSQRNSIIGVSNNGAIKKLSTNNGLPSPDATAISIDKDNHLWIGTTQGLRVLYNTANFFNTANPQAEPIIILDNGIAKELLFGQIIKDIVTDGSNNKWIATNNTGVFYLTANGQKNYLSLYKRQFTTTLK